MRKPTLSLQAVVWSSICAFSLSACSQNNLPDYIALGGLRVLTVVADQPEANPGSTITLTPVISDLNGGGRALSFTVQACIDPGIPFGKTPSCAAPEAANSSSGTIAPPANSSQTYTGAAPTFTITLPASDAMFAGRTPIDQYNGVPYIVLYTLAVPGGGASVTALKRIMVSATTKTPKNANPLIASVDLNQAPVAGIASTPTSKVKFRAMTSSSTESYSVLQRDGSLAPATETLISTWFITDGSFDAYRTIGDAEDEWTPPSPKPAGRGSTILVVTRDGRGGEAYQAVELN